MQTSAIDFSVFVDVNSAIGIFDDFGCLRDIFERGDFEKAAAVLTGNTFAGGIFIEQPGCVTSRALCDNLHYLFRRIPL